MRNQLKAVAWVAALLCAGIANAQNAEVIRRGKQATALVVVKQGSDMGWGSAFCISSAGYFVTNAHVIPESHLQTLFVRTGGPTPVVVPGRGVVMGQRGRIVTRNVPVTISLVLNPGEAGQIGYPAHVVRLDRTGDLAVLVINAKELLTTLAIGDVKGLVETAPVTAFGYPFGQMLAEKEGDYPNITVSTGKITSLRKTRGELSAIQLDAALNPGNSGGPVVDEKGRIIGIVEKGIPGASINFAIPATHLTEFIKLPLATVSAPSINPTAATQQTEFTIRLLTPSAVEMQRATVSFELSGNDGKTRTFAAKKVRDQVYSVMAAPLVKAPDAASSTDTSGAPAPAAVDPQTKVPFTVVVKRTGQSEIRLAGQLSFLVNPPPTARTTWRAVEHTAADAEVPAQPSAQPPGQVAGAADSPAQTPAQTPSFARGRSSVASSSASTNIPSAQPSVTPRVPPGPLMTTPSGSGNYKTLNLAGPAEIILGGAGGRVLVMWIGTTKQLAFFDVRIQKIEYVSLDTDRPLLAVTNDKLLIALPDRGVIERWSLQTHKRELSKPLSAANKVSAIAAGELGSGPLLVGRETAVEFLDIITLAPSALQVNAAPVPRAWSDVHKVGASASADGKTFAVWPAEDFPQRLRLMSIDGKSVHEKLDEPGTGLAKPSADGRMVIGFTKVLNAELAPIDIADTRPGSFAPVWGSGFFVFSKFNGEGMPRNLYLYSGDRTRLIELPEMLEMNVAPGRPTLSPFVRLHVIPSEKLIASLNADSSQLILREFDLAKKLAAAGGTHLFVTSFPPRAVARGALFDYAIEVNSGAGGVSYSLENGPPGMTVTPNGHLRWNVPASAPAGQTSIILLIKDKSGREIYHNFDIWIG